MRWLVLIYLFSLKCRVWIFKGKLKLKKQLFTCSPGGPSWPFTPFSPWVPLNPLSPWNQTETTGKLLIIKKAKAPWTHLDTHWPVLLCCPFLQAVPPPAQCPPVNDSVEQKTKPWLCNSCRAIVMLCIHVFPPFESLFKNTHLGQKRVRGTLSPLSPCSPTSPWREKTECSQYTSCKYFIS